jgi:hypothetical protein
MKSIENFNTKEQILITELNTLYGGRQSYDTQVDVYLWGSHGTQTDHITIRNNGEMITRMDPPTWVKVEI